MHMSRMGISISYAYGSRVVSAGTRDHIDISVVPFYTVLPYW